MLPRDTYICTPNRRRPCSFRLARDDTDANVSYNVKGYREPCRLWYSCRPPSLLPSLSPSIPPPPPPLSLPPLVGPISHAWCIPFRLVAASRGRPLCHARRLAIQHFYFLSQIAASTETKRRQRVHYNVPCLAGTARAWSYSTQFVEGTATHVPIRRS